MKNNGFNARLHFFFLLLFAFAAAIIGDNAAEALVLERYDAVAVSRLFSINALVLFVFSLFSMTVVDKFNRAKLAFGFIVIIIGAVFLSWVLALFGVTGVFLFIYALAYLGKILLFFFVWTLANDVADSRSGAEDFPVIAAGGTLGAILTTLLIPRLLVYMNPMTLLLVWILPLVVALVLVFQIYKNLGDHFKRRRFGRRISLSPRKLFQNLTILQREPVLRSMSVAYYLLFVLIFVQQFHFYQAVRIRFQSAREISQFLGYFYGISMISTFILQITIAGRVTRAWGIIRTLFVQPAILGIAFLGIAVAYQFDVSPLFYFNFVVAGVGLRIAFMDSFFSPNYQNFFSTLPNSIRGQSKLVMEGVMKPLAMISTTAWIAIAPSSELSALVMFAVAILAGVVLIYMKESYVSTLIHYLAGYHTVEKKNQKKEAELFRGSEAKEVLQEVFDEGSLEIQLFVVQLLGELRTEDAVKTLVSWYEKTDYDSLKREILHTLATTGKSSLSPFLYKQISSSNPYLAAAALRTIDALQVVEPRRIESYRNSPHPKVRAEALVVLAHKGALAKEDILSGVQEMLNSDDVEVQGCALSGVSRLRVSVEILEVISAYWYRNMDNLIKHGPLLKYYLRVVNHIESQDLLCELLDCVSRIPERNRDMLVELLTDMAQLKGAQELLRLCPHSSAQGHAVVLEALGRSSVLLSRTQVAQIHKEAHAELAKYQQAKDAVAIVRSHRDSGVLQLLADALEREVMTHHAKNCMWYAALMDRSGKILHLIDRAESRQREIHAQILEVVDTVGNPTIRQIFKVLFGEGVYRIDTTTLNTIDKILAHYVASDIMIVRQCSEYAQWERGEHESQ